MRLIYGLLAVFLALSTVASDTRSFILITDGRPSIADDLPAKLSPAAAVWTWSTDCLPERLTAAALGQCRTGEPVTFRIVTKSRKPAAGAEIRWATEAMLRELPDALLPVARTDASGSVNIPMPSEEPVFARIAGPLIASKWTAVSHPCTTIAAVEGAPISWRIKDADGNPAVGAMAELRPADAAHGAELPFRGAGDGVVNIPAVPAAAFVHALSWSEAGAPALATGRVSQLLPAYELPRGVELRGLTIDAKSSPVSGASVTALFLVGGQALRVCKTLTTDREGRFGVRGIPAGEVEWSIEKPGLARVAQVTRITADHDLGDVAMYPDRQLVVEVRDAAGAPIAGALLTAPGGGAEVKSDARGIARLVSVPADTFKLRAAARGFLLRDVTVKEDVKQPFVLVLRDAAQVRARVVRNSDGMPAGPGTAAVDLSGRKFIVDIDARGELEIDAREGGRMSLEIRAAGLAPYRVPEREVGAAERVDLGTIRLRDGLTISGRAVDAESSAPLPGVTFYVLRPDDFGPQLSYARRDWVTSQTLADGTFRLEGLAEGVYTLWSESTGHAPLVKTGLVLGSQPAGELALGDLSIEPGRTLTVACTPVARCRGEVSVSIAGADWLPISGALGAGGEATVAPVPSGPAVLRLTERGALIHEREIAISAADSTTEINLRLPSVVVRGDIVRSGKPVSGGTVSLEAVSSSNGRFVQMAHVRSTGTLGNRFVGAVPRRLTADVGQDGTFLVEDMAPGDYRVTWTSANGIPSATQRIAIPESSDFSLRLDIPSARLEGRVRTADGQTPGRTLVTVESGGSKAEAFAGSDGTFVFDGLPPGLAFVRANASDQRRSETSVEIAGDQTERVDLTLEAGDDALTVDVRAGGMPMANAYVFLRQNGALRVATTSAEGQARIVPTTRSGPVEIAVNAPAYGWSFVPAGPADGSRSIRVDLASTSTHLVLRKETGSGLVSLFSSTGFPIHEALSALGVRAAVYAGSPLQLDGLPSGTYSVGVSGVQRQVTLAREPRFVDF